MKEKNTPPSAAKPSPAVASSRERWNCVSTPTRTTGISGSIASRKNSIMLMLARSCGAMDDGSERFRNSMILEI